MEYTGERVAAWPADCDDFTSEKMIFLKHIYSVQCVKMGEELDKLFRFNNYMKLLPVL